MRDKRAIENVLRRATKCVPGLYDLPYDERLRKVDIASMKYRLFRIDLVDCYKLINNYYNIDVSQYLQVSDLSRTRGHSLKLKKNHCRLDLRKNFFTMRVVNIWNALPAFIADAASLSIFKRLIDDFYMFMKFDYFD